MNLKNPSEASFFKILLRDSIDRLPLPPAFARKYLETGNNKSKKQTVVLTIKSGVKWNVTYLKIKDEYYFMDGWLKFMKDNCLQFGNFLVFWGLSGYPTPLFQVSVFEPNGCLRHPTTLDDAGAGASNRETHVVDDETSDDELPENVQRTMTRVFRKSYLSTMPISTSFIKATGINVYESLLLRNEEGTTWEVKLITDKYGRYERKRMGAGWCDFRNDNRIKVGNRCEFCHVNSNLLHVRVLAAKEGMTV